MSDKVALITLHRVRNYGSVLQAYASQQCLNKLGFETTIIDYIREDQTNKNILSTWAGNNFIKKLIVKPTINKQNKIFEDFCRKNLKLTEKQYVTNEDFKEFPLDQYDLFCTGSDQVWNSKWNKGYLFPLYLSFVKGKFKFGFSVSFGNDTLSNEEIEATKEYVDQYSLIAAREKSGEKILKNQYNFLNSFHVLDPTLMLTREDWNKLAGDRLIKDKYILIYNLNRSKEFDQYAKKLSKKTGLNVYRFCTRYDQFYRYGKSLLVPNVYEFINYISNAEYVLTDSFHATAFSLNLNVTPISFYPSNFGGRISQFLELTQTLFLHPINFEDFSMLDKKVDFSMVNEILNKERKKTYQYLETVKSTYKEFKGK